MGLLFALWSTGCAGHRARLTPEPPADVQLVVYPPTAFAPALLVARLRAHGVGACPEVRWDYGDGSVSTHAGDCAPGSSEEEFRESKLLPYHEPGDFLVVATVGRGRAALVASQPVTILGRGEPPEGRR